MMTRKILKATATVTMLGFALLGIFYAINLILYLILYREERYADGGYLDDEDFTEDKDIAEEFER
jgi:hypothetical protein